LAHGIWVLRSYLPGTDRFYTDEVPEEKRATLRAFADLPIVSISNNQRRALPDLTYAETVYNSLDIAEYPYVDHPIGDYLLWVGRMSPKKGALEAIEIATKLGIRLQMAAALDPIDQPYFDANIRPKIDGTKIVFHGELTHEMLMTLYGNAKAVLYPISWHEPFGLVMIESMACGTPVVAYNIGSVPEVVEDGVTGLVLSPGAGIQAMVDAVKRIGEIDRKSCRTWVEKHFHKDRMVADYERVYQQIVKK
jgi:glycosyltransferase involved in cell wall biosynthesis